MSERYGGRSGSFWWLAALGVLMILLGIAAIAQPFVATVATTLFLGSIFVIGGVIKFIYSIATRREGSLFFKLFLSVLYFAAGLVLLFYPVVGVVTVTLIIGTFFVVKGIAQIALAFNWRPDPNWGWTLFAGLLGVIIGLLVLGQFPSSAAWVIGLLVGITLFFDGIWLIAISSVAPSEIAEEEKMRRKAA